MSIGVTDEHEQLMASVRSWVERHAGGAARRAIEEHSERIPDWWPELRRQDWIGLPIHNRYGGSGYSLVELAIVLEELGRACLPGPFLPTALAAVLLQAGGGCGALLTQLVQGTLVATVDLHPEQLHGVRGGDGWTVSGRTGPVMCGGVADLLVAPFLLPEGTAWVVLPRSAARVEAVPSTDATRRLARWSLESHPVQPDDLLAGLNSAQVAAYASALFSAEAAGVATWCLETAVDYAKVRRQFGRPIGQFQAVKHRAADMLASVELARAVAWDAARAAAEGTDQMAVAAQVAAAVAPEAAYRCARQCIQIHGAIGFTWAHDAHIYLKRALVSFQIFGGRQARSDVAAATVAGWRREAVLELPPDTEAHREPARRFFRSIAHLDSGEQRRRMADSGYLMPQLPRPWGCDADAAHQLVIDEERERAGVALPFLANAAFVIPTLIRFGTVGQQELIGPSLRGELNWCQLFSEPEAGSDLASLRTKAVRVPGGWSISGQKVWTTRAHLSQYGICLARTDPDAERHRGITYFLVDMGSEGVDVRPLAELDGNHHFNEVFLSDVFVPDEMVVGEVNDGWRVANATLGFERVAMGGRITLGDLAEKLAALIGGRRALRNDQRVLEHAGELIAIDHAASLMRMRSTLRAVLGASPGPEASLLKVVVNENQQRLAEYGLELLGEEGACREGQASEWLSAFFYSRLLTIAGGTSEIQRNVIARRLLGLPRDP